MVYDFAVLFVEPHLKGPAVTAGLLTHALLKASGVAVSDLGTSGSNRLCQSVYGLAYLPIASWSSAPLSTDLICSHPWVPERLNLLFVPLVERQSEARTSHVIGVPSLHL